MDFIYGILVYIFLTYRGRTGSNVINIDVLYNILTMCGHVNLFDGSIKSSLVYFEPSAISCTESKYCIVSLIIPGRV